MIFFLQINSFYITNMKSKLKFFNENFNENEFETTINEISEALIKNTNFFDEKKNKNNNEDKNNSFDLFNKEDESNLNDLLNSRIDGFKFL
ncbi:hypothetical protein C2G38_2211310 [Gigaspora rosea]|uniref:Uncharacterized protein n=1 Tax=Gigaspora rosea TaxID=44941 RepID=A0A397UE44_9GLOM|nr:hypothetical protein C2G38_2211310 [Gigaspora rosea]